MTVPYTVNSKFGRNVATLLLRWKGSIFKLVWPDLLIFLFLYYGLSLLYRFVLDAEGQRTFEHISVYCEKYGTLIPVSFVLGFYVSLVIGRWWAQYKIIPWVDNFATWVNTSIPGEEDEIRLIRRTVCRYICLAITQCFILVSPRVKKRFPTTEHLIFAGLLLENEKLDMEDLVLCGNVCKYQTHWIPFVWATSLVAKARTEGKIVSDSWMKAVVDEINKIKDLCNSLLGFDRIKVPLVYTQVVTFAVYSYFFSCLMGRQWVQSTHNTTEKRSGKFGSDEFDLFIPVFTILQFLFYIGWLKVAETLVNPFGDDDYDFELNWMVDRHLQVSYLIVDKMHLKTPTLKADVHWDEVVPAELPHTLASLKYDNAPPETSTSKVVVSHKEGEIMATTSPLVSISTIANVKVKMRKKRNEISSKMEENCQDNDNDNSSDGLNKSTPTAEDAEDVVLKEVNNFPSRM